jgi:hypothetical protein
MEARMRETGAVKALFCDIETVDVLEVQKYTGAAIPAGLKVIFNRYPAKIYYPYSKGSQASPAISKKAIILIGTNPDPTRSIEVYALDSTGDTRAMGDAEIAVGTYGGLVNFSDVIIELNSGGVLLLGREDFNDDYNRMFLDSFARDKHGRLMTP